MNVTYARWNVSRQLGRYTNVGYTWYNFGTPDISDNNMAIPRYRFWPQTAKYEGHMLSKKLLSGMWIKRKDIPKLELSLSGVGTVLRLERDALSMAK